MARDLTLFYHYYIPSDVRAMFWNWWLDEQMPLIIQAEVPFTELYITMPKYWNEINGISFMKDGIQDANILFKDKVEEYLALKYGISPIEIRDTGEPNIYEGSTLLGLWEYCKDNPNEYIGYIHNKGVVSASVNTYNWRQYLNQKFITEWRDRYIELLQGYDVVGLKDAKCDDTILSGNFFYASTNYIATLEEPSYTDRYQYEKWILSGNPKVYIADNTNVDHFLTAYLGN